MEVFFDTEFTELHQQTTLVSIGLVAATGEAFYAEATDYNREQVTPWIQEHVLDNLLLPKYFEPEESYMHCSDLTLFRGTRALISAYLHTWLTVYANRYAKPCTMWSDCLAYDWVLFCELFGGALHLPDSVYYIPFDICTVFNNVGEDPDVNREEYVGKMQVFNNHVVQFFKTCGVTSPLKHNSLWDAYVIRECWNKLNTTLNFRG